MDPEERLPAVWPDLDVRKMLRRLVESGVDFVIIGGIALWLHGYPRVTRDLDIAFAYDDTNLEMLGRVLVDLKARLRGVEENVPFVADDPTLKGIDLLTVVTSEGWLDVHRMPRGISDYERLRRNAEQVDLGGFSVLVASPDDLIAMKEATGRSQDRIDVAALETIKRLRTQLGTR